MEKRSVTNGMKREFEELEQGIPRSYYLRTEDKKGENKAA